jgi:hypothetical protein
MNETATAEKGVKVKTTVKFLPYMCENAPAFTDIDKAVAMMPPDGIDHTQREIWKWAPKRDEENKVVYENKVMVMVKVVTRTSKRVRVKTDGVGLTSYLISGRVEPMDYTDVKEVIELLKQTTT